MTLENYIESVRREPFSWQSHNCASFVNGAVKAQRGTGVTIRRLCYGSESEAMDAQARNHLTVIEELNERLHPATRSAKHGDILARQTRRGTMLGVCVGDRVAFLGKRGLVFMRVRDTDLRWSIK